MPSFNSIRRQLRGTRERGQGSSVAVNTRGAAMAEGAIMLVPFVLIWTLTLFFFDLADQAHIARRDARFQAHQLNAAAASAPPGTPAASCPAGAPSLDAVGTTPCIGCPTTRTNVLAVGTGSSPNPPSMPGGGPTPLTRRTVLPCASGAAHSGSPGLPGSFTGTVASMRDALNNAQAPGAALVAFKPTP
ncbi:MAG: hypothetical protein R3A78_01755 [Polyangiales bacterium]